MKELIHSRFKSAFEYLEAHKAITSRKMAAEDMNMSPQHLSEILNDRSMVNTEILHRFCNMYDINLEYIFYGTKPIKIEKSFRRFNQKTDTIKSETQLIPIYNIEATAGIVTLFENNKAMKPIDHLSIPHLPKCDGALYVTGDSMYPLLKSGDIVIYKQIHDMKNNIFWGEMYLINVVTNDDEFTTVKYIQKSDLGDDYVKLVSHNKHHQDKEQHISGIKALALVKASVRINSMS